MKNIVECSWLNDRLDSDNVFVLDCRFDLFDPTYGRLAYSNEHVKNSFYIDINDDLSGPKCMHGGARPLPDAEMLGSKLSRMGIGMDSHIVVYDDKIYSSPRAWWQLKYLGYKNVHVLNGGFGEWKRQGLPVSSNIPNARSGGFFAPATNPDIYCNAAYVEASLSRSSCAIVDSRSKERYSGEYEPLYSKKGHIKSAVNMPWHMSIDDSGIVRPVEILNQNFSFAKNFDEIITYCGSGIEGAVNFLLLHELGFNVRLYVGSFSDWISYDSNLVESGL